MFMECVCACVWHSDCVCVWMGGGVEVDWRACAIPQSVVQGAAEE
jgi:hypothetical protein